MNFATNYSLSYIDLSCFGHLLLDKGLKAIFIAEIKCRLDIPAGKFVLNKKIYQESLMYSLRESLAFF